MKVAVVSFSGPEPKVISAEQQSSMLKLMTLQLEVLRDQVEILQKMATSVVLVPDGCKLRVETKGD